MNGYDDEENKFWHIHAASKYFYNECVFKINIGQAWFLLNSHSANTRHECLQLRNLRDALKKLSHHEFGVVNVGENYNAEPVSNKTLLVNSATEA